MPTIALLNSIKIALYFGDHAPSHFHAYYNEYEVLIEIETLAHYRGKFPNKQYRELMQWAQENQEHLRRKWQEFNPLKDNS